MRSLNELLWDRESVGYILPAENEVEKELPQLRDICHEILSSCGGWGGGWGGGVPVPGPGDGDRK